MITLLLATRNAHKVSEIRNILGSGIDCLSLDDFPYAPSVHEDGATFSENAAKKAIALAEWLKTSTATGMQFAHYPDFVLADDSGLEVDALNGAPGVHSARFAATSATEGNSSDTDNLFKLLHLLENVPLPKRGARFCCVLALVPIQTKRSPEQSGNVETATKLFSGTCEGKIAFSPAGSGGFGYDPAFVPTGYAQSFSELGDAVKNQLSHRGKALAQLKDLLDHFKSAVKG